MKRILIISGILLVLLALGFGVYFAWTKSKEILNPPASPGTVPVTENQNFGNQAATATSSGGGTSPGPNLKVLSKNPVFDYWVSGSSSAPQVFYLGKDGKIMKAANGNDEVVVSDAVPDAQSVKASSDGKYVILKFGDVGNPIFTLLNMNTKEKTLLTNVEAATFSPDGKKIAFLQKSATTARVNLIIKTLSNMKSASQTITSLRANDFDLSWISTNQILLLSKPSFEYEGELWSVAVGTGNISLIGQGRGAMAAWSSDGEYGMFYSVSDDRAASMNLIKPDGSITANLDFATFPSKCFLAPTMMYCALPQFYNAVGNSTMPDDYLKRAAYSSDFIYSIDMNQNALTALFTGANQTIDATHLKLRGNTLFFVNRYDDKVYSLAL